MPVGAGGGGQGRGEGEPEPTCRECRQYEIHIRTLAAGPGVGTTDRRR